MSKISAFALLSLLPLGTADIYLHNPAGSNNRNRERNENRNNANRLFDSQNNGKGGYPWRGDRTLNGSPDPLVYYEGSELNLEWTVQHGCGPSTKTSCMINIQLGTEFTMSGLRDGYPSGGLQDVPGNNNDGREEGKFNTNNQDGTNTIPANANDSQNVEYGRHELFSAAGDPTTYQACTKTERNKGLYTADQNLAGNTAQFTRQNPNGGRSGLECPEERDYFPYWRPTPWIDVAVLTSDTAFCPMMVQESQNVKDKYACICPDPNKVAAITAAACAAQGCTWTTFSARGLNPPECKLHAFSRDNHLGSTVMEGGVPETANYKLKMPTIDNGAQEMLAVIRIRYNTTTMDYDSTSTLAGKTGSLDSTKNCKNGAADNNNAGLACGGNDLTLNQSPRYNRPYVQAFGGGAPAVGIAMNTNQLGRTFQDRSYVFKIAKRPANIPNEAKIWNLNTRGKRGNIVQSYPAVEYDFVPNRLEIKETDYVHIQWTGSDFNTARAPNDAEGWEVSDRTNMMQVPHPNTQLPLAGSKVTMFKDATTARSFALLNQESGGKRDPAALKAGTGCKAYKNGDNGEQNNVDNCGKLNSAAATQNFGAIQMSAGIFHYACTRNNNFSNRSQKGTIVVNSATAAPTAPKLPTFGNGVRNDFSTGTSEADFSYSKPSDFGSASDIADQYKASNSINADSAPLSVTTWVLIGVLAAFVIVATYFFVFQNSRRRRQILEAKTTNI